MLGTLQVDIDTCIREYKAMSPEIFPVGYLSGSKVVKLVNTITGTPGFDPAPLERAVKRLVVDHLKDRIAAGTEERTIPQEPQKGNMCTQGTQDTSQKNEHRFRRLKELFGKTTKRGSATPQDGQKTTMDEQLENTLLGYDASRDHKTPQCKVWGAPLLSVAKLS